MTWMAGAGFLAGRCHMAAVEGLVCLEEMRHGWGGRGGDELMLDVPHKPSGSKTWLPNPREVTQVGVKLSR